MFRVILFKIKQTLNNWQGEYADYKLQEKQRQEVLQTMRQASFPSTKIVLEAPPREITYIAFGKVIPKERTKSKKERKES